MRQLMIAGMRSGSGKTLVTMGLARLLMRKKYKVQMYKTGPDYIDPMFHTALTGRPCVNLDPWFLEDPADGSLRSLRDLFYRHAGDADFLLVEAAMGLCDGITGQKERGSALKAAEALKIPVLFLAESGKLPEAAAYLEKLPKGIVRGVVINRAEKTSLKTLAKIPVLGSVPELPVNPLKSRHLGLSVPNDPEEIAEISDRAADAVLSGVNFRSLLKIAEGTEHFRFAAAKDEAFSFWYEDNLRLLRENGAEPVFFSPLRDHSLPAGISGLWLPGGYPELYAEILSVNEPLREDIRDAVQHGLPTVAECGGFMYLCEELEDSYGRSFPMCGVLPGRAYRTPHLRRFGYIELTAKKDTLLLRRGQKMKSHEFHYWDMEFCGDAVRAEKASGASSWDCIFGTETLFAGYPHIYLPAFPEAAEHFADACRVYRDAHGRN